MNKERISGIVFFIFSLAYLYQSYQIPLYPGEEFEPFTAQTMPIMLGFAGSIISVLLLLFAQFKKSSDSGAALVWQEMNWLPTFCLLISMVAYGFLLQPLGFIAATTLFLLVGFYILGERRIWVLALVPVLFVVLFWAILNQLLGIYLAPSEWFST